MSRARDIINEYGLEEAFRAGVKVEKPFANFKSRASARADQAKSFGSRMAGKAKETKAYKSGASAWKNRDAHKATAKARFSAGRSALNKKSGVLGKDVGSAARSAGSSIKKGWQNLTKTKPTHTGDREKAKERLRNLSKNPRWTGSSWRAHGKKNALVPTGRTMTDIVTGRKKKK